MNLWLLVAGITFVLKRMKINLMGVPVLSSITIVISLVFAGISAFFSFGVLGQVLLVPVLFGLLCALVGVSFVLYYTSLGRRF